MLKTIANYLNGCVQRQDMHAQIGRLLDEVKQLEEKLTAVTAYKEWLKTAHLRKCAELEAAELKITELTVEANALREWTEAAQALQTLKKILR